MWPHKRTGRSSDLAWRPYTLGIYRSLKNLRYKNETLELRDVRFSFHSACFCVCVCVCVCSRDGSCKMNLNCKVQGVLRLVLWIFLEQFLSSRGQTENPLCFVGWEDDFSISTRQDINSKVRRKIQPSPEVWSTCTICTWFDLCCTLGFGTNSADHGGLRKRHPFLDYKFDLGLGAMK